MNAKYAVENIHAALRERRFPTITLWNRLEGRPRAENFDRALKAEVRDALWMLTKQWQTAEFKADDAGSPVFAKLRMRTAPVTRYQPGASGPEGFPAELALETRVEQRPLRWKLAGHRMHLDLRAQAGRQWDALLVAESLESYRPQYLDRYNFELPLRDEDGDAIYGHRGAWQQQAALTGRWIDGGELLQHLVGGGAASDEITLVVATDGPKLDDLGEELRGWFAGLYSQPEADDTWKPPYLEYQFACAAPHAGGEQRLNADEFPGGHLDWYSFDRAAGSLGAAGDPGEQTTTTTFLPTGVAFEGMPDPRWWKLEDRKTNFGAVKPSTTDLAQLLLMEFALVYADDWFLIPCRLPAGTLAHVDGLAVTNTFGERQWIRAAGTGSEQDWHRWAMFQLSGDDADTGVFLPPVVAGTLDGAPLEEAELARDEVANMVWAVETTVPSVTGAGSSGKDEARETRAYHEQLVAEDPADPLDYAAAVAYLAMTDVPEHFIPFIPTHVPGSQREIQLQRARMLRIIDRDKFPPAKIPPRTELIRQGLDDGDPYYIHEEEVPRAGVRVRQAFRRARWTGGQAYVWLGEQKRVGRGERSSGLAFDSLVRAPPEE